MIPLSLFAGLLPIAAALSAVPNHGSNGRCQNAEPSDELIAVHQKLAAKASGLARRSDGGNKTYPPLYIDTYIHVIATSKNSSGYFSQEVIDKQLALLNDSFSPGNIWFIHRKTDWTINTNWAINKNTSLMKSRLRKSDHRALNLFYLQHRGRGICTAPDKLKGFGYDSDGCIMDAIGPPSKLTVHEVGHWFGLLHTFQGNNCTGPGDYVDDTPASAGPSSGCPTFRDSCPDQPGEDPYHNFMDYSNDACGREFTQNQFDRMHDLWTEYRAKPRENAPPEELTPLTPVEEKGKLPFYPSPENQNLALLRCGPDENNIVQEKRENYCGTPIWCYLRLWERTGDRKFVNWRDCLYGIIRVQPRK